MEKKNDLKLSPMQFLSIALILIGLGVIMNSDYGIFTNKERDIILLLLLGIVSIDIWRSK